MSLINVNVICNYLIINKLQRQKSALYIYYINVKPISDAAKILKLLSLQTTFTSFNTTLSIHTFYGEDRVTTSVRILEVTKAAP